MSSNPERGWAEGGRPSHMLTISGRLWVGSGSALRPQPTTSSPDGLKFKTSSRGRDKRPGQRPGPKMRPGEAGKVWPRLLCNHRPLRNLLLLQAEAVAREPAPPAPPLTSCLCAVTPAGTPVTVGSQDLCSSAWLTSPSSAPPGSPLSPPVCRFPPRCVAGRVPAAWPGHACLSPHLSVDTARPS